jgi:Tol biopolymer transport system component/methionine-rich copper-binding protein CopC
LLELSVAGPNDAPGEIVRISTAADGTPAHGDTYFFGFSPDGAKVLLRSYATNLVPGLDLTYGNVRFYVKDLTTGEVTLVSPLDGPTSSTGDTDLRVVFASNGSIVITSRADNLVPGDTNGAVDIFTKDLGTGAVTRLTTTASGAQANGDSSSPDVSPDGHRLAFYSSASNLVAGDTNNSSDLFIKNLDTGVITRVSTTDGGAQLNGELTGSQILWNANQLFFTSDATNTSASDSNGATDLFVKDLNTGTISRISDAAAGVQANGSVEAFKVSHDGTKVAFWSGASNLVAGDTNGLVDLFIKDLTTGTITRVSTSSDGTPTDSGDLARKFAPSFSADDKQIAFLSFSGDLVPGDTNGGGDIFVKDLVTGLVTRVSTAADGSQGLYQSPSANYAYPGGFSPDGSMIAFTSEASGLVDGAKAPSLNEAFIKTLHPAPGTAADTYVASYSAPLVIDAAHGLLANDATADGKGALTVTAFSDAQHGRVDLNPDGSFTYTPDGAFVGIDSFTYKAGAGYQSSPDTTVTIKVTGNIERVDTQADGSQAYYGVFPQTPVLSPDGKYVALVTHSSDLAPNPYLAASQVVLKNLATGALTIASGPSGGDMPVFSPDGTKIAFSSGYRDIVVMDLASGASTVVSTLSGGTTGVGASFYPVFSPDSASILFRSASAQLTDNLAGDLFVKNLTTGAITRVSTAADGTPANGQLVGGSVPGYSFSSDGHWIVFASSADNLVAGDTNNIDDIFVKNLQTGQVIRVSTASDGAQSNGNSETPVFSPDGKSVAFQSGAENLVSGDTNKAPDIFIKNLETGAITRVSTGANGEQATETTTGTSGYPVFSPDGTRIAFVSAATNLVPGVGSSNGDIYEKNLVTGAIRLVSDDSFGTEGNGWSTNPTYSADGKKISFVSFAANLVPGDTNGTSDVFIKDLTKFPYDPSHPVDVAPVLVGKVPADDTTDVAPTADLTLNFDKTVRAGHGVITITGEAGDVRTIDVTDAAQVTFSGAVMTINPTNDLAAGQTYHVTFAAGVVADAAGTAFTGLSAGALDFTTATPPPTDVHGKAVDGYLSGATVFVDTNGDHALSAGEVSTTSDSQGNFTLPGGGALVAIGGVDIATGLAFEGYMSAPSGATVITPLTTLAQLLAESGVADPVGTVLQALGLPAGADLLHTDPVAANAAGDPTAFALLAAGAAVISDVALIAAGLEGQANATAMSAAATAYSAFASVITGHPTIDLTDASLLQEIVTLAGLTGDAADRVLDALSSTNGQIEAATNLAALTVVQTSAQGVTAEGFATPAAPAVTLTHDTGASATDHITSDAALTVTPSEIGGTIGYTVDGVAAAGYDPTSLPQGGHTIAVTQTNASGHVSAGASLSFTYDTIAPDLLVNSPAGSAVTDQPLPLSGSVGVEDAGRTIQIMEGATLVGSALASSDGAWHGDVTLHGAGDHTLLISAADLAGNTDQVSTTITVSAANRPPVAGADHAATPEHTPLVLTAAALLANDVDPDGDALSLISVGDATHGAVSFDAAHGTVTFTPTAGYSGGATFTYTVSDGQGGTANGAVDVTVEAGSVGGGWGDVHYTTLDGVRYDLQSTGDYIIAQATSGPAFTVQGRAEDLGQSHVSYLTAVAIEAGEHLVVFDEAKPEIMLVDGHAVAFAVGDSLDLGGGLVIGRSTATTHQIQTSVDFVEVVDHGDYLDLSVHAAGRAPGGFEGLLGNFDGDTQNDFVLRDGSSLSSPTVAQIEGLFADAWRVGADNDLLSSLGSETIEQRASDAAQSAVDTISIQEWYDQHAQVPSDHWSWL